MSCAPCPAVSASASGPDTCSATIDGAQQQLAHRRGLAREDLLDQERHDRAVVAREVGDQRARVRVARERQRRQPEPRRPALGARDQLAEVVLGQLHVVAREQLGGLRCGEGEVGPAQLGQLARDAQAVQRQVRVVARAEHEAQPLRAHAQQRGQDGGRRGALGVLQVVDDQDERRAPRPCLDRGGDALGQALRRGGRRAAQGAAAERGDEPRPDVAEARCRSGRRRPRPPRPARGARERRAMPRAAWSCPRRAARRRG